MNLNAPLVARCKQFLDLSCNYPVLSDIQYFIHKYHVIHILLLILFVYKTSQIGLSYFEMLVGSPQLQYWLSTGNAAVKRWCQSGPVNNQTFCQSMATLGDSGSDNRVKRGLKAYNLLVFQCYYSLRFCFNWCDSGLLPSTSSTAAAI